MLAKHDNCSTDLLYKTKVGWHSKEDVPCVWPSPWNWNPVFKKKVGGLPSKTTSTLTLLKRPTWAWCYKKKKKEGKKRGGGILCNQAHKASSRQLSKKKKKIQFEILLIREWTINCLNPSCTWMKVLLSMNLVQIEINKILQASSSLHDN